VGGSDAHRHGGRYLQDGKVYASKMHYGQMDSDSVKNVQIALRNHDPRITLPVTGNYLDMTKAEVEKFQKARGWRGAQADGIVGPSTAAALELVWIDDTD
jgi:peptidoglycan hydrolase-like protein with peptidoglycan-binding domain